MKNPSHKKKTTAALSTTDEEVLEAEREFGMLLAESWEAIYKKPQMYAKVVRTAKKIRELHSLINTSKSHTSTIH